MPCRALQIIRHRPHIEKVKKAQKDLVAVAIGFKETVGGGKNFPRFNQLLSVVLYSHTVLEHALQVELLPSLRAAEIESNTNNPMTLFELGTGQGKTNIAGMTAVFIKKQYYKYRIIN